MRYSLNNCICFGVLSEFSIPLTLVCKKNKKIICNFHNDSHQYSHDRQLPMDTTYCPFNTDDTLGTKLTSAFNGRY